jgi:Holliday junction resolvase RusA-like endonuclease
MIHFFAAGVPVPKGSMKAFVRGKRAIVTHDNAKVVPWASLVSYTARQHVSAPLSGPIEAQLVFALPRPKSLPKRHHAPTRKPDVDKLARLVLDALTGIAWQDDAQVVSLTCAKQYANVPGVTVTLYGLDAQNAPGCDTASDPCYATPDARHGL